MVGLTELVQFVVTWMDEVVAEQTHGRKPPGGVVLDVRKSKGI